MRRYGHKEDSRKRQKSGYPGVAAMSVLEQVMTCSLRFVQVILQPFNPQHTWGIESNGTEDDFSLRKTKPTNTTLHGPVRAWFKRRAAKGEIIRRQRAAICTTQPSRQERLIVKHSREVLLRFEPAANAASLLTCYGCKTLRTTPTFQGRDDCFVWLDDTRERWFAAGEPVKNAPQDIRIEPNRQYIGVPLHQHGTRTRGTDATST